MAFKNAYEDPEYAAAYADLGFTGTYHLAFRDLPGIFSENVKGHLALDFGCGTGRSTRYLRSLGFQAVGVDISQEMIDLARRFDPIGDYRLSTDGGLMPLGGGPFDLVFSAFTFDNIPGRGNRIAILSRIREVLSEGGVFVNLISSPDLYTHEWVSFSTQGFPENARATDGDLVRVINREIVDDRPVQDVFWSFKANIEAFEGAGLGLRRIHRPLGRPEDPVAWVNESRIPPWTIFILERM